MQSPLAPPKDFIETFNFDTGEMLVEVVASTYKLAVDLFKQAKPYSDANTFGTELYRFAGHKLNEAADEGRGGIQMVQTHPNFVHRIGKYDLYCHRVAKKVGADIWHSFPNPETEGVERCSTPFLPGLEPDLEKASSVVLAHIGNADVGLCSLHICLPVRTGDGGFAWGYVHELYSATIERVTHAVAVPAPIAQPEDVATAVVRRRTGKKSEK